MAKFKVRKRTTVLKVNDVEQIFAHFNNRHERAKKPIVFYTGTRTPFGALRFWR